MTHVDRPLPDHSATAMPDNQSWVVARTAAGSYRTDLTVGPHTFTADEPLSVGGGNAGPTPYEYLLSALGACTAMTIHMYAARKTWPLDDVIVRLRGGRSHAADCENCEGPPVGIRRIERQIELSGSLTDEQRQRLLEIADRCPVKQTFERGLQIVAAVEPASPERGAQRSE
ncbi:MAG TPA: OsmC family protein [Gemmatimonadaceae bacterium]|nr:OsmC family protein [Gemmatimonadaceae bacterium]